MNTSIVCCLLLCLAVSQALVMPYMGRGKYGYRKCVDFYGRLVKPGRTFSPDGCNTCGCGRNGRATFCTRMACKFNLPHNRKRFY